MNGERVTPDSWGRFLAWAVFGVAAALGLLVFGTLGALPIFVAGILAATRPGFRRSGIGVVAGVGAMSLYVAFVQRQGPGTVCWQTARASGCDEHLNPWPWLIVGVVLVAGAVAAFGRRRRIETAGLGLRA